MSTRIGFVVYPVSDMSASRRFYGLVLETEGIKITDDWIEYGFFRQAFAITQCDADHCVPVRGAVVAFEVPDLKTQIARLRSNAIKIAGDVVETAICRFVIVRDPDGSEFLMHQRKKSRSA